MAVHHIKKAIEYTSATLLNKSLVFLLLPIITRFLSPEEFGIYSLLMIFVAVASFLYQAGLQQSLMTYYYHQHSDQFRFTLISTVYISIFIIGLLLSFVIIFFRQQLANIIISSNGGLYSKLFIIAAILILFDVFTGLTLILLNIMEKSKEYSILSLTKNGVFLGLIIFGMLTKKLTIDFLFAYLLIASILSAIHSLFYLRRVYLQIDSSVEPKSIYSFPLLRQLLGFGIYMLPGTFAVLVLQTADRYMLNFLSVNNLYDVGIYSAAYRIGMIISLLTSVFDLVFFPYVLKQANSPDIKKILYKIFSFYLLIGGLIGGMIILFAKEIFLILGPSYIEGAKFVFVGVISMFLRGLFNTINLRFYILKQSKNIAFCVIAGAILNIILNFLLIPRFGIYGAGIASIVSYFLIVLRNYFAAERKYPIGYPLKYIIVSIIFLLFISSFNYFIPIQNISTITFKIVITSFLIFILVIKSKKNFVFVKEVLLKIK